MGSLQNAGSQPGADASVAHKPPIGDTRKLVPAPITPMPLEGPGAGAGLLHAIDPRELLLTTKRAIPPLRAQVVARPHLTDLLDQGLERKLTLVVAPAGYGKTSLLSAWAQRHTGRLAW